MLFDKGTWVAFLDPKDSLSSFKIAKVLKISLQSIQLHESLLSNLQNENILVDIYTNDVSDVLSFKRAIVKVTIKAFQIINKVDVFEVPSGRSQPIVKIVKKEVTKIKKMMPETVKRIEELESGGESDQESKSSESDQQQLSSQSEVEVEQIIIDTTAKKPEEANVPIKVNPKKRKRKEANLIDEENTHVTKRKREIKKKESKVKVIKPPKWMTVLKIGKYNPDVELIEQDKYKESDLNKLYNGCCIRCNNKNVIRAAILGNTKMLKACQRSSQTISTLLAFWSPEVQECALDYIIKANNQELLELFIKPKIKVVPLGSSEIQERNIMFQRRIQNPGFLMSKIDSGMVSHMAYGAAVRGVQMTRGNRQGNNAFLEDNENPQYSQVNAYLNCNLKKLLTNENIDYETYRALYKLKVDIDSDLDEKAHLAVRAGNLKVAYQLIKDMVEFENYGFNKLHLMALSTTEGPVEKLLRASVTKKANEHKAITPLHCACINPDPKYLKAMIDTEADIDTMDKDNWRVIHYAAACTGTGPLKLLISKDVRLTDLDKKRKSCLHIAAISGRSENVRLLLTEKPELFKIRDRKRMTALAYACQNGHIETVKVFQELKLKLNARAGGQGMTPLIFAAAYGHLELVKYLVEAKARVIGKDKYQRTPLILAARNGHTKIASYLLQRGSDWNHKDSSMNTPLHYAAAYGWLDMIELLIKTGADINAENSWKITPITIALLKNHFGCVKRFLKEPSIDVNGKDDKGHTLLMLALMSVDEKTLDFVKYLIKRGANVNQIDIGGNASLHIIAKQKGNIELQIQITEYLIFQGAELCLENLQKQTAFDICLGQSNFAMLEILKLKVSLNKNPMIFFSFQPYILNPACQELLISIIKQDMPTSDTINYVNNQGLTPILAYMQQFMNSFEPLRKQISQQIELFQNKQQFDEKVKQFTTYESVFGGQKNTFVEKKLNKDIAMQQFKEDESDCEELTYDVSSDESEKELEIKKVDNIIIPQSNVPAVIPQKIPIIPEIVIPVKDEEKVEAINNIFYKIIARPFIDVLECMISYGANKAQQIKQNLSQYIRNTFHSNMFNLVIGNYQKDLFDFIVSLDIPLDAQNQAGEIPLIVLLQKYPAQDVQSNNQNNQNIYNNNRFDYARQFTLKKADYEYMIQRILDKSTTSMIDQSDAALGRTPFLLAYERELYSFSKQLIKMGADVNHQMKNGMTALRIAIKKQNLEEVRYLVVDCKADVNTKIVIDKQQVARDRQALQPSLQKLYLETDKDTIYHKTLLFEHIELNSQALETPQFYEITKLLIENGIQMNHLDHNGYSALIHLLKKPRNSKNYDYKLEKLFIENGADVQITDPVTKQNILFLVIQYHRLRNEQYLSFIEYLLNKGIDINHQDFQGYSIFNYVLQQSRELRDTTTVYEQFFLDHGLLINSQDRNDRNILHHSINASDAHGDANFEMEQFLIESGVDINQVDKRGRTPVFYYFVKIGNWQTQNEIDPIEGVSSLCGCKGLRLDIADLWGKTPLHYAAQRGSSICAVYLIQMSAPIDPIDIYGNTSLGVSIIYKHFNTAIFLLQKNASVHTKAYLEYPEMIKRMWKETEQHADAKILVESWKQNDANGVEESKNQYDGGDVNMKEEQDVPEDIKKALNLLEKEPYKFVINQDSAVSQFKKAIIGGHQSLAYLMLVNGFDLMLAMQDAMDHQKFKLLLSILMKNPDDKVIQSKNEKGQNVFHKFSKNAGGCQIEDLKRIFKAFLKKGVGITDQDSYGKTPLHYAVENKNLEVIKQLLPLYNKDSCKLKDDKGRTVLHHAVLQGSLDIFNILCSHPEGEYDLDHQDLAQKMTVMHYAVSQSRYEIAQYLTKSGKYLNLGSQDHQGKTPLHHAMITKSYKMADLIINMEEDCNLACQDYHQRTVVHYLSNISIFSDPNVSVKLNSLDLLVKLQAKQEDLNLTAQDINQKTALHYSVMKRNFDIMKQLLKIDCNLNAVDQNQKCALHHAVENNYIEAVQELLQAGCNANLKDWKGKTVLHFAVQQELSKIVEILIIDPRYKLNLDPNEEDKEGFSAVQIYMNKVITKNSQFYDPLLKESNILFMLTKVGGNINYIAEDKEFTPAFWPYEVIESEKTSYNPQGPYQCTPLIKAIRQNTKESLMTNNLIGLLEFGARPDVCDSDGRDAIMHAILQDNKLALQIMLNYSNETKLNTDGYDKQGRSAAHMVVNPLIYGSYENVEMLDLLHAHGYNLNLQDQLGKTPSYYASLQESGLLLRKLAQLLGQDPEMKIDTECWPQAQVDFQSDSEQYIALANQRAELAAPVIVPVDSTGGFEPSYIVYNDDKGLPYDTYLTKIDLKNGIFGDYVFYKMQLLYDKNRDLYVLFTRWGRIGETGMNQRTPFTILNDGKTEYLKIFKQKTGNNFEELDKFERIKKKYNLAKVNYRTTKYSDFLKPFDYENAPRSNLPRETFKLFQEMCDISMYHKVITDLGIDQNVLPFSNLSQNTLDKARMLLNQLEDALNMDEELSKQGIKADFDKFVEIKDKISDLSSAYYELIPNKQYHNKIAPPLKNLRMILDQQLILDNLDKLKFASKLLLGAQLRQTEMNPIDYVHKALNLKIQPMEKQTMEYEHLIDYIDKTREGGNVGAFNRNQAQESWMVQDIYQVERPSEAQAIDKFKEVPNHFLLFHGSMMCNFIGILSQGLRIAPREAPIAGAMFGKGVYFADMFEKSFSYAARSIGQQENFLMLICEVVLGEQRKMYQHENIEKLEDPYNSVMGMGQKGPNYEHPIILPNGVKIPQLPVQQYIQNDQEKAKIYPLQHNEFVVYDTSQVRIRYLVQIKKGNPNAPIVAPIPVQNNIKF